MSLHVPSVQAMSYELDDPGSIPGRGIIFLFSTGSSPVLGLAQALI
jgi:hypothetical protein